MKVKSYLEYFPEGDLELVFATYQNGRMAIQAVDPDEGDPIACLTVNMPEIALEPNQFILKDYAENAGALETLVQAGLAEPVSELPCGFAIATVCNWLGDPQDGLEGFAGERMPSPRPDKFAGGW